MKKLARAKIIAVLARLSELAAAEDVRLEMTLHGSVVMLLAFDARSVTKDVAAIVHPPEVACRLAAKVASEMGLHDGWLNDDVKQFVSARQAKNELPIANSSRVGLHVTRPTAKYLLAMKVMACRKPMNGYAGDYQDIEMLLRVAHIETVDQVQTVVDSFFPDTVLTDAVRLTLSEILKRIQYEPQQNHTP